VAHSQWQALARVAGARLPSDLSHFVVAVPADGFCLASARHAALHLTIAALQVTAEFLPSKLSQQGRSSAAEHRAGDGNASGPGRWLRNDGNGPDLLAPDNRAHFGDTGRYIH